MEIPLKIYNVGIQHVYNKMVIGASPEKCNIYAHNGCNTEQRKFACQKIGNVYVGGHFIHNL